jgi:hypothetical protein
VPKKRANENLKQVATRVPIEVWRVIHLAMVLEGQNSEQAFLRPRMKDLADQLLKEQPELRNMLRVAKESEARRASATTTEGVPDAAGADPDPT